MFETAERISLSKSQQYFLFITATAENQGTHTYEVANGRKVWRACLNAKWI